MARPRTRESRIYWKRGGAYADFRHLARWGGKREALKPEGSATATSDPDVAAVLYAARLEELQELKRRYPDGLPERVDDPLDRFAPFAARHLAQRKALPERRRPSENWLDQQRRILVHAARFFTAAGKPRLDAITSEDVGAWLEELRRNPPRKTLSEATLLKYLHGLGGLFRRAVREGRIQANPVHALLPEERPSPAPRETPFLEVSEAALYLEACRRWTPDGDAGAIPFLHELVATYLMTGGREAEITGLLIDDLDFDRDLVHIRPNEIRSSLKTLKRSQAVIRALPMHPQLREILRAYLDGPRAPKGPLLFPGALGPDRLLTDFRKALDSAAALAGFPQGAMRTKVFRVTWTAARLQCLDHGAPISPYTVAREAGHGSLKMVMQVYGRLGRVRQRLEHLEYRWPDYAQQLGHRLDIRHVEISDRWRRVLASLPPGGAAAKEWERASGTPAGTFYYVRDQLVSRGLVAKRGQGRGATFHRTPAGDLTLEHGSSAASLSARSAVRTPPARPRGPSR